MRLRTAIVLICLAAFAFVAAEDGDSEESVIEQLVVETLVSWVKDFIFMNDYYYKSPRMYIHVSMQTCLFTMLHLFLSTVDGLRVSFPYDVHSVIFLNIMFLTILGEARGMHDYIRDGRHASNPLHGKKYNALRLLMS